MIYKLDLEWRPQQGVSLINSCFSTQQQSAIPRFPNMEGLASLCDVLNYSQQLLQVNSTEPATAVTALVAEQVCRDACLLPFQYIDNAMQHSTMHWSSNIQLKTVSNGLLQSCSGSELAFFCTQLTLNLRNSAPTTSQVGLPSLPADICEQIKNHFAKGSPERERLNANTDC